MVLEVDYTMDEDAVVLHEGCMCDTPDPLEDTNLNEDCGCCSFEAGVVCDCPVSSGVLAVAAAEVAEDCVGIRDQDLVGRSYWDVKSFASVVGRVVAAGVAVA